LRFNLTWFSGLSAGPAGAIDHRTADPEQANPAETAGLGVGVCPLQLSPLDINIDAWAVFSFSDLNAGFTMPIPFFDDDLVPIAPITANCHVIRYVRALCRAGRSDAISVADLVSTRGREKQRRTCESGCNSQRVGYSHPKLLFLVSDDGANAEV
jgi:hypothetical protein